MNIPTKYEPYSGTIFNTTNDDIERKSIFVSIVCYKDELVINTIHSLFSNAKRPENIFLSVAVTEFRPHDKEWINKLEKIQSETRKNIKINIVPCSNKTTLGELKKISDSEYNKENYYMSVSSRSEFDPHWDEILIKQYDMIKLNLEGPVAITAEPRKFLYHDDIVKGFVYFTNHKTKLSFQREEYDGARIPYSGYSYFINDSNINHDSSSEKIGEDLYENMFEKNSVEKAEKYLQDNGFPKFVSKKFTKNEYISIATGFCYKFVFSEARSYLKDNPANSVLIDENHLNFYSMVNLLKNKYTVVTLRFTPVYILFNEASPEVSPERTPEDLYNQEDYKHSEGHDLIYRLLEKNVYKDAELNYTFSIDWEKKVFKSRTNIIKNSFIDSINFFISLYNFSINENSLHWNKKC